MFIIWGFGRKTTKMFGVMQAQEVCDRCNNMTQKQLIKVTTWFTLFFIPIIPYRREYWAICPICRDAFTLSKEEFEGLAMASQGPGGAYGQDHSQQPYQQTSAPQPGDKYFGKSETQIAYLKQMEEYENQNKQQ